MDLVKDHWYYYVTLAIPIFFGFKWLVSKYSTNNFTILGFSFLGTLLTTPLIFRVFFFLFTLVLFRDQNFPDSTFDQTVWSNQVDQRFRMSNDLLENYPLIGLSRSEVIDLLGYPNEEEDSMDTLNHWRYEMGTHMHGFGIKGHYLVVYFGETSVDSVKQHSWTD